MTVAPVRKWSEARGREAVYARSLGVCEGCGMRKATDWAHRMRKGPGGWAPSNGLHLCGPGNYGGCHGWSHQFPKLARDAGWIVPSWGDPSVVPVFMYGDPWSPAWWLLGDGLSVTSTVEEAVAAGLPERPVLPEWAEWSKT